MIFRLPAWLLVTFLWLVASSGSAQTKRANHWYFGFGSAIDFNTSPPTVTQSGTMEQLEGSASISDEQGRLLFYTDGRRVWTSKHTVMPNGSGLLGDESASQSALIVPKPGSQTLFYVFTVPAWGNVITVKAGLAYSLVDISLNQGLGDVVAGQKNITLLPGPVTEKLAATLHSNGEDVWVVASKHLTNAFYAYRVSRQGVAVCPVVSPVGQVQSEFQGYLKFSPDGTRVAAAQALDDLELFTFDACTGTLSPYAVIPRWGTSYGTRSHFYGVSFSPNGSKLYVSTGWFFFDGCPKIYQYDLTAQNIGASRFLLYDNTADLYTCFSQGEGALQLAPDGKIYIASWNFRYLHVIASPDEAGAKAGFVKNGMALGVRGGLGLPNFIESYFNPRPSVRACASTAGARVELGNDTILCPGAILPLDLTRPGFAYRWQDGSTSPVYPISKAGTYWVDWTTASCTSRDTIRVTYDEPRHISLGNDTILCAGQSLTLSFPDPKLDFSWSDRSMGKTLVVDQPGTYWVRYRTPNTACWESDSVRVSFIACQDNVLIPNVITPNGDGRNDVFTVVGLPPVAWRLEVYDRWGKQVADYEQYRNQWNAQGLENGLYYYMLSTRVNKQRYRGWIHVLR